MTDSPVEKEVGDASAKALGHNLKWFETRSHFSRQVASTRQSTSLSKVMDLRNPSSTTICEICLHQLPVGRGQRQYKERPKLHARIYPLHPHSFTSHLQRRQSETQMEMRTWTSARL